MSDRPDPLKQPFVCLACGAKLVAGELITHGTERYAGPIGTRH